MFAAARADPSSMENEERELTLSQARVVAHIRAKHPDAILTFHARAWGYILEVAEPRAAGGTRTIALARFEPNGDIVRDTAVA
jgi:hypothetical protein